MPIRWSNNSCPSDAIMSILGNLFLSMNERCSREDIEAFFPLKFRDIFLDCSDASGAVSRWRALVYRPYLDINDLTFGHTAGIDNVYSKLMLEIFFPLSETFPSLDELERRYRISSPFGFLQRICSNCSGVALDLGRRTQGYYTLDRSPSSWSIAIRPNIAITDFDEAVRTSIRQSLTRRRKTRCRNCSNEFVVLQENDLVKILFLVIFNPTGRPDPFGEISISQNRIPLQFSDYSLLGVIYIIHGPVNHFISRFRFCGKLYTHDGMINQGICQESSEDENEFFKFKVNCGGRVVFCVGMFFIKTNLLQR